MKTSLRDIVLAVRYGEAAMVGESAGYLVLGAADRAVVLPRLAHLDSVTVSADGVVELEASVARHDEVEASLRQLLGRLLRDVRRPCPNLMRVAERRQLRGLPDFVTELEAALVPVNRRAARRSLSRLVREAERAAELLRHHAEVEEVTPAPAELEVITPAPVAELQVTPAPAELQVTPAPAAELHEFVADAAAPLPSFDVESEASAAWQAVGPDDASGVFEDELDDDAVTRVAAPVAADAGQSECTNPLSAGDQRLVEVPMEAVSPAAPAVVPLASRPQSFRRVAPPPPSARAANPPPAAPVSSRLIRPSWKAPAAPIDRDVPLIAASGDRAERQPSDVADLLAKMRVAVAPSSELFDGLKRLSQAEQSSVPPAVEA